MVGKPVVSIIIPVYNGRRHLARALKSALAQDVSKEVICIDDGSTDGSALLLKFFSILHKEVRVLRQDHSGSGAARNLGMKGAEGEFIAFLDADDRYPDRTSLRKLTEFADDHGIDICGGFRILDIDTHIKKSDTNRKECEGHPDGTVVEYSDTQIDYDYGNFVFRRSLLEDSKILFPEYARYQDVVFLVSTMAAAKKYGVVPVDSYCYYLYKKKRRTYDLADARGMLSSMGDVIRIAEKNGYTQLKERTAVRLKKEYLPLFPADVREELGEEVSRILENLPVSP